MDALPRCTRHHGATAGWSCRSCGRELCPACAATARAGTEDVPACGHCGGFADPITRPRAALRPYPAWLARAAAYPFRRGTVLATLAAALVLAAVRWLPLAGAGLAFGLSWAFFLGVVRQSAAGADELGAPEEVELLDAVLLPALRGLLALAIVWVPAAVRAGFVLAAGPEEPVAAVLADPVMWLLLLAGVLYAPAALLHAAFGSLVGMLDPIRVVGTAVRLGTDYLVALAAMALGGLLGAALSAAAGLALGAVPVVGAVAVQFAGLIGTVLTGHALGLLLHVRGDSVGLGRPEDYLVPVLGAAVPLGTRPEPGTPAAEAAGAYRRPEAISLDDDGGAPVHAAAAPAPAPTPDTAPPPSPEAVEIARLAGQGDLAGAARRFAATRPPPVLPPAVAFAVGRGAYQAGLAQVAAEALHQAGVAGDPAVSPSALLVLGRLYAGRLGRHGDAREVLAYLLATWPESDAARHGQAALSALGPR